MQRFKIEDLVVQDASGVVFRAIDSETGQLVAVRRFFPYGASGSGLSPEEQREYGASVSRLAKVTHPALRTIVCGGCDPVDGMPFVATEWIEGSALQTFLGTRPLSQPEAISLISQALEVCQALSDALGAEGVWVETDLHTIIIGAEETRRPVTFWISPLKWLGVGDGQRGLEPLIGLTTSVMGWGGKPVSNPGATGLGTWLKWLQGAATTATLQEARERLAASTGSAPPQPVKRTVRMATRPVLLGKKKAKSKLPVWILAVSILAAMGGGGWFLVKRNESLLVKASAPPVPVAANTVVEDPVPAAAPEAAPATAPAAEPSPAVETIPGEASADRANRMAAELTAAARKSSGEADAKAAQLKQRIASAGGVFSPADHELLVAQNKNEVVVEGTFGEIGYSTTRKTMYLLFSGSAGSSDFRGAISEENAKGDLSEASLQSLSGKKIRLKGSVRLEPVGKTKRPVIDIRQRNEILLAE